MLIICQSSIFILVWFLDLRDKSKHQVQESRKREKIQKMVHFPMKAKWYDAIKNGEKKCELRAASQHWLTRVNGASHCSFTFGALTIIDSVIAWFPVSSYQLRSIIYPSQIRHQKNIVSVETQAIRNPPWKGLISTWPCFVESWRESKQATVNSSTNQLHEFNACVG